MFVCDCIIFSIVRKVRAELVSLSLVSVMLTVCYHIIFCFCCDTENCLQFHFVATGLVLGRDFYLVQCSSIS